MLSKYTILQKKRIKVSSFQIFLHKFSNSEYGHPNKETNLLYNTKKRFYKKKLY